tara:strand:- start:1862 stop:2077 length:216 start_codon:yes stop_codon:yes gene_type:complete
VNKEIVELVAERIEKGKETYPDTIPREDERDFLHEALEEALDMCVYLAGEILRMKKLKQELSTKVLIGKDY